MNRPGHWKCGRCDSGDESLEHSRHCRKHKATYVTLCCLCDKALTNSVKVFVESFGWCHWHCAMNEVQKVPNEQAQ